MIRFTFICLVTLLSIKAFSQPTFQNPLFNSAGTANNQINAIAKNNTGEIYFCGKHTDPMQFGSFALATGQGGAFFGKTSSSGTLLWLNQGGCVNPSGDNAYGVAVDHSGDVYFCGTIASGQTATFGSINLANPSLGFIAKYNPSGNLIWATGYNLGVHSIAIDQSNTPVINLGDQSVYKIDPSNGNLSINYGPINGNLQNVANHNIVVDSGNNIIAQAGNKIVKFDSGLNQLWSTPITASLLETFRITLDNADNIFSSYYAIFGTVTVGTVSKSNFPNSYMFRLNSADGSVTLMDSILIGGNASKIKDIIVDPSGNYYMAGDGGFNTTALLKTDNAYTLIWQKNLSTTAKSTDIELVGGDCLFLSGYYSGNATFDSYNLTLPAGSNGIDNSYLTALCAGSVGLTDLSTFQTTISLYPNPAQYDVSFTGLEDHSSLCIYNMLGIKVLQQSEISNSQKVNVSRLEPGNYSVEIINENYPVIRKKMVIY